MSSDNNAPGVDHNAPDAPAQSPESDGPITSPEDFAYMLAYLREFTQRPRRERYFILKAVLLESYTRAKLMAESMVTQMSEMKGSLSADTTVSDIAGLAEVLTKVMMLKAVSSTAEKSMAVLLGSNEELDEVPSAEVITYSEGAEEHYNKISNLETALQQ